jgi:hypothetical protein
VQVRNYNFGIRCVYECPQEHPVCSQAHSPWAPEDQRTDQYVVQICAFAFICNMCAWRSWCKGRCTTGLFSLPCSGERVPKFALANVHVFVHACRHTQRWNANLQAGFITHKHTSNSTHLPLLGGRTRLGARHVAGGRSPLLGRRAGLRPSEHFADSRHHSGCVF